MIKKLSLNLLILGIGILLYIPALPAQDIVDLLILNGRIVDGSGNPWYYGDLAVDKGKIVAIGKLEGRKAKQILDAEQQIVCPGFIDVHGHIEGSILKRPQAENLLRDGVCSMITGNCGGSRLVLEDFWQEMEQEGISINVGSLIGHNAVRRAVMGNEDRAPSQEEMQRMKQMIQTAMEQGALGLSTGLLYLPGMFAKTEDIVELAKTIAPYNGVYTSHIRYQDHRVFKSIAEAVEIGEKAQVPVEISHIKIKGKNSWGQASRILKDLNTYRNEGIDVSMDQYPYTAASTSLSICLPQWVQEGGREKMKARLADPQMESRVRKEMKDKLSQELGFEDFSYAYVANCRDHPEYNGKNIPEICLLRGETAGLDAQVKTIIALMQGSGRIQMIYHFMGEEDVQTLLQSPLCMIASDGGIPEFGTGSPHPRSYGTNARILSKYVRGLSLLSLEEAIQKMTSLPAHRFHLEDRGLLKVGKAADILIFDPASIKDNATFQDPHAYSTGIAYVLVNGQVVINKQKHTGIRSGQILRSKGLE